jgi:hypothetical protein
MLLQASSQARAGAIVRALESAGFRSTAASRRVGSVVSVRGAVTAEDRALVLDIAKGADPAAEAA